jgi:predicted trehalose synthase
MTTYQEYTRQVGDQWVAALKRAEEAVTSASQNVQEAVAKLDVPQVPVPEQVSKFSASVAEKLPKPSEILQANFELTERLLAAQQELALKVLAAATREGEAASAPAPTNEASST